jgi:subtilase family serine protease
MTFRRLCKSLFGGLSAVSVITLCLSITAPAQDQTSEAAAVSRIPGSPYTRVMVTGPVDNHALIIAHGALTPLVARAKDHGSVAEDLPMEHIQMGLLRAPEVQKAFDTFVDQLHRPGSSNYHKWLTPQEIGENFGPAQRDIAKLTLWLESQGFKVNFVSTSGMVVDFSGDAGQVRDAFHTEIHNITFPNGDKHIAAVREAQIPQAFQSLVAGFPSMSDIHALPMFSRKGAVEYNTKTHQVVKSFPNESDDPNFTFTCPASICGSAEQELVVGATDFYTIYNETPLLSTTTGTGQTVAVIEESDITTADVTTFRTSFGVTPNTPLLTVQHGSGTITCTDPGKLDTSNDPEESEADIDAEWAGTAAPGATVLFESCASTTSTQGILLSAEAVVDGNLAVSASLSYGIPEALLTGAGTFKLYGANSLWNNLWEQAAAQGITIAVSSGDSGVALEDYIEGDTFDGLSMATTYSQTVNGLGSTPWNVSAGGTDFQDSYNYAMSGSSGAWITSYWNTTTNTAAPFSSAKSYVPETTWNGTCASSIFANDLERLGYISSANNNPYAACGEAWKYYYQNSSNSLALQLNGGGGGLSTIYSTPSWQSGVYGVSANVTGGHRGMPDISLFASNGFWGHSLAFCDSDPYGGSGSSTSVPCTYSNASDAIYQTAGGTSFVAPQLAGIMALVAQKTGERQGQADYVLYQMAANEYGTTSDSGVCLASGTTSNTGISSSATYLPASSCAFYDVTTGSDDQPCYGGTGTGTVGTGGDPACYSTTTYDVKVGSTTYRVGAMSTSTTSFTPTYNATVGYDLASGIGSVNIANLVNGWIGGTYSASFTATVALADATLDGASWSYGNPPASSNLVTTVTGNGSLPTGTVTDAAAPTVGTIGSGNFPATGCSTLNGVTNSGGNCQSSNTVTVAYAPSATLAPASYTLTSTYSTVNENYSTGANDTLQFTITGQALTFGTGSVTPNSVAYSVNTSVALSQVINRTGSGSAPTASDFYFTLNGVNYAPTSCSGGTTDTCTYTVAGATIAALAAGSYPVTFNFTSDGNYAGFTGHSVGTLTITTDTDKVTVTPAPTSIGPGGSSVVTIAVSNTQASATSTPAGSVKLVDTTNASLNLGTCTLSSGSCTITVPATSLVSGANTLTATYTASPADWATGTTGTGTLTLTSAPTTSVSLTPATTGSTTTGVTTATLTATITAASNDGLWGGTVTFTNSTTGATYSGTVTGSGTTGSAAVTITLPDSGTSAGLDNYTAKYNGTANYSASAASNSVAVYWQGLLISTDLKHDFSGLISYGSPAITVEGTEDGTKLGPYGVVVYNFTTASQTVGLNFANASSGAFSYVTNCPASLAAGKTCNYYFYYAPPNGDGCNPKTNCTTDPGPPAYPQGTYESGTWQITSGATLGIGDTGFDRSGPVVFPAILAGKAVLSTTSPISVTPLTYTFGPLAPSELSNTLTITVTNPGAASVGLSYTPPVTTPFQATNYCPANLAANSNCTINVTFQNSTTGTVTDKVVITPSGGSAITVSLTGIVNTNNGLQLSTNSHNFGNVTTGSSAASFGLSITNHASTSATLSFGTSQSGTTPYNVVTSGCPSTLAAGAQCSVVVSFSPTAAGTFNDVLTVNSNVPILPDGTGSSPNYSDTVSFTGTGVSAGQFTATSVNHNWGNVTVGTTGTNYGVQLTNATSTTVTLTLGAGFTQGQYGFSLAGSNCGSTLAVNASCELIFSFSPTGAGAVSASYGVTAVNTSSSPVQLYSGGNPYSAITLVGTGQ